ncbi:MAG TPA: hypothetical protein VND15_03650 [Candidatus Acidoferrales bacterium]|nr:hypothetical protein [Candidatus Acidoferrales bacterium]
MTQLKRQLTQLKYASYLITGAGAFAVVVETARIVGAELLRQAVAHPIMTGTTATIGVGAIVTGLVIREDVTKFLRELK